MAARGQAYFPYITLWEKLHTTSPLKPLSQMKEIQEWSFLRAKKVISCQTGCYGNRKETPQTVFLSNYWSDLKIPLHKYFFVDPECKVRNLLQTVLKNVKRGRMGANIFGLLEHRLG